MPKQEEGTITQEGVKDSDFIAGENEESLENDGSSKEADVKSESDVDEMYDDHLQDEDNNEAEDNSDNEDDTGLESDEEESDKLTLEDFDEDSDDESKGKDSGLLKRVNKLTAQKKALEEENDRLRQEPVKKEVNKVDERPKFSRDDLSKAVAKGIEDNDPNLIMQVFEYMSDNVKDTLRKEYTEETNKKFEKEEKVQKEWVSIIQDNSDLWEGESIYPGAKEELDLRSNKSLLNRLAMKLYWESPKKAMYQREGGQRLAVADALTMILKKKRITPKSKETVVLKKRLAKEKRKTSLSSGKSSKKTKTSSSPRNSKESLEDYIADRKKSLSLARDI